MPAPQQSPNNSFIPKRGPARRVKRAMTRQVYLFTIVLYVLIFTSLVSAAAVYGYEIYVERQRDAVVLELNEAVSSFNESDFERVARMQSRISQAESIIESQVSYVGLLELIEQNLSPLVMVRSLSIAPEDTSGDGTMVYEVSARMATEELDVAIFQRDYISEANQLQSFLVNSLTAALQDSDVILGGVRVAEASEMQNDDDLSVEFDASFIVQAGDIPVDAERFIEAVQRSQPAEQSMSVSSPADTGTTTVNGQAL